MRANQKQPPGLGRSEVDARTPPAPPLVPGVLSAKRLKVRSSATSAEQDAIAEASKWRVIAEQAEKDKAKVEKRHKDYIKSKGKEVSKLKETISQSLPPEAAAQLKKQYETAQSVIDAKQFQDFIQSGSALSPQTVYGELIDLVKRAYTQSIEEAKTKGAQYEKEMDEKEKEISV